MSKVEIRQITKHFGEVTAVDHVDFEIREGEFFSLLGPSGCGKTTLLRMLSGLEFPSEGQVLIDGGDVTYLPAYRRPSNLVFQHLALFPHMSIEDNVAFGLKMKHVSRAEIGQRVSDALRMVDLEGYGQRRPSQLSGGQQQRVAIARALVNRPEVLLFDEPLGALDLKLRLQMQGELKALQQKSGITFIYVTHDQGEAMAMSDRIAVMQAGRIHQIGTPREIYSKPVNSFVATFIGDTNLLTGKVIDVAAGCATVQTDAGLSVRAAGQPPAVGEEVRLSVRQELIKLGREAENLPNRFQARVEDVLFAGSVVKYTLCVGSQRMVANVVNSSTADFYTPGVSLLVGWDGGDVVLLAK